MNRSACSLLLLEPPFAASFRRHRFRRLRFVIIAFADAVIRPGGLRAARR
jgi:hypothetical protein